MVEECVEVGKKRDSADKTTSTDEVITSPTNKHIINHSGNEIFYTLVRI